MSTENDGATPPRPDFPPPSTAGAGSSAEPPRRSPGGGEERTEQFAGVRSTASGSGASGHPPGSGSPDASGTPAAPGSGDRSHWAPPQPPGSAPAGPPPPPPTQPGWSGPPPGGSGWESSPQPGPAGPGRRRAGGIVAATLAAALLGGGVGGGIGYWAAERDDSPTSTTVQGPRGGGKIENPPGSVAAIANNALPSVVTIEVGGSADESLGGEGGGTGTGFVYDKQGHILTNNHVVAAAGDGGDLTATFSDGKTYDAEVVGQASGYDVAVIKLTDPGDRQLVPLPLGDSDKADVGDQTIAIGSPFGLSGTVTTGIISAKNRPVASGDATGRQESYMNALQTDASINPGNSGGPLLDQDGSVIGVNSAIRPADNGLGGQGGSIGLGFAIPINQADWVAQTLIETGTPVYAIIGVSVDPAYQGKGAKVTESAGANGVEPVTPGGPADKAGIEPGDVITKLDDTVIDSGPTLIGELWSHRPGAEVRITYERDGEEHTVDVTLGERKGDQ